ncbi:MAG: endonuclease MutS2 [Clostridia bacterium]|nr:endonuclease MutS2 [Clostridia bacterium]
MNEKALRILEFDKIREILASLCMTDGAKRMALSLSPSSDEVVARRLLEQTTEAKKLSGIKGMPYFGNISDIREATGRAEKSAVLTPGELLDVAKVLKVARGLLDYIRGDRDYRVSIEEIFERLIPDRDLEERITRAIISEDMIADEASPKLADIRRKMRNIHVKITETLQKYVSGSSMTKYLQENIITTRGGRFVIPVKSEYKNEVKGLVHDVSSSGATLFIEPSAIVDANNELKTLESLEKHEIERILSEFSAAVADRSDVLCLDYLNITELAFIFAKADLSFKMDADMPFITDKREIDLIRARHPLLDKNKVVPITVSIGDGYRLLVITGPNTGGKTVTLKTIGLFAAMAQSGLHIPCEEGSSVCMFDDIYSDIGDEQSIEQSLSTFSAHMVGIVSIIDKMTDRSLVLFDELGAGTDPVEGAALAVSILEEVRNCGAICAATTHYAELKAYAIETDGVCNASCEFNVDTLMPTYRLIIGSPGKSNAFEISKKLGLQDHIVARAEQFINSENRNFEEVISKLDRERFELSEEKERVKTIRLDTEIKSKEAEEKLKSKLSKAEAEAESMKKKAKSILDGARATSDYILAELDEIKRNRSSSDFEERLAKAKRDIRSKLREASDVIDPVSDPSFDDYVLPRPLKKGDVVIHKTLGSKGTVLSDPDKNGNVEVQMGIIKSRVSSDDLILDDSEKVSVGDGKSVKSYTASVSKGFSINLDVRGQNGDEAWLEIDKYLDEAQMASVKSVTVIHGKGTGALRSHIWKMLKGDKRVKSYRAGQYGEGDYGVTVIDLK